MNKEIKRQLKKQAELVNLQNIIRNKNIEGSLNMSGMQENISHLLKPVIQPIKEVKEELSSMKTDPTPSSSTNQTSLVPTQHAPISRLNTDPILGVTTKLAEGIRPTIQKNPPRFMIGKREIPINIDEGVFEIDLDGKTYKIPITQNLINLINGDDENFDKYNDIDYSSYYFILLYAKEGTTGKLPKRMKKLEQIVMEEQERRKQEPIVEEPDDEEPDDDYDDEETVEGEGLTKSTIILPSETSKLFDELKVLISARNEGHNNVNNKIHAILKELLNRNHITINDYKIMA
jgi:hypothetical protein